MNAAPTTPGGATRDALITAAIRLFGRNGFEGASTRQIAAAAKVNIAAIAYHFGGKAGLRAACGAAIAERIGSVIRPETEGELTPDGAAARLDAVIRAMVRFLMLDRRADDIATFMLREIGEAGVVLDIVYARLLQPRHRDLCRLWGRATGAEPESEAVRLAVFAMIGQVVYFRIGQPVILRRMGWPEVEEADAEAIADVLASNLHAVIDAERRRLA